jgi:hypothetical protein
VGGIEYARRRIVNLAQNNRRLTILRQQKFNQAPSLDLNDMGVLVMPYIEGFSVMAKQIGSAWEFGYSGSRGAKVETDPYVTSTPHDLRLLDMSQAIQDFLGFPCEIEYIVADDGEIFVVQAKDISQIETLGQTEQKRAVKLDGIRRVRRRRNYRERTVFVLDVKSFYLDVIGLCEDMVLGGADPVPTMDDVVDFIANFEYQLEQFALSNPQFAILGLSVGVPEDLFQVANHYLNETPKRQELLSETLRQNAYRIDEFIAVSDTLITMDRYRLNLCTHDAYGIDTVRTPLWNAYWSVERHNRVVRDFSALGFTTGETVGIDIGPDEKPLIYRL